MNLFGKCTYFSENGSYIAVMGMSLVCILLFKLHNDIQTLSTCVLKLLCDVI